MENQSSSTNYDTENLNFIDYVEDLNYYMEDLNYYVEDLNYYVEDLRKV